MTDPSVKEGESMELTERTAVVTGGGTGIGAAVAAALVAQGVRRVLITYSRSATEAEETVAALRDGRSRGRGGAGRRTQ